MPVPAVRDLVAVLFLVDRRLAGLALPPGGHTDVSLW
jgi:hypothetical protein